MPRPFLTIDRLDKSFGDLHVLDSVSFEVERGEVLALLGPSGSGKTTLLRLLAGFETPDGGAIRVEGSEVTRLAPAERRFGMVFQHYALFPHLSVGDNVAFGLESQGVRDTASRRRRVEEVLALVDLAGFEPRRPGEISGGQQQRVALARALAPEPRLLLLDEPLSNLDPALRERTRRELGKLVRRIGITTVLVTHEQEEAFALGDRVAVLHDGRLEQVGRPEELYERPATRFVATFVGRSSLLAGRVEGGGEADGAATVRLEGVGDPAAPPRWSAALAEGVSAGSPVDLVVRPEALELAAERDGAGAAAAPRRGLAGRIVARRYLGTGVYYLVELDEAGTAAGIGEGGARRAGPGLPEAARDRRTGGGGPEEREREPEGGGAAGAPASPASPASIGTAGGPEIEVLVPAGPSAGPGFARGDRVRVVPRESGPLPHAFLRQGVAVWDGGEEPA